MLSEASCRCVQLSLRTSICFQRSKNPCWVTSDPMGSWVLDVLSVFLSSFSMLSWWTARRKHQFCFLSHELMRCKVYFTLSASPVFWSWSGAAHLPLLRTSSMTRDTPRIAPLASILQRSFRSHRQSYRTHHHITMNQKRVRNPWPNGYRAVHTCM